MEDRTELQIKGFLLVISCRRQVYIYSWEKTEQNEICRLWERPAAKQNAFLTATISHNLGSRLSTGNGPCSLGNDPSPSGTVRPC